MKKVIVTTAILVALYITWDYAHYRLGWYVDLHPQQAVQTFMKTDAKQIYMRSADGEYAPFEIRGVNMGSGIPGEWATDFKIDKATYLRWFGYIQDMGANTLRVYTIQSDTFYNALYAYNLNNPQPLYLLQGVWVNDYVLNSRRDAFDDELLGTLLDDCRSAVDMLHGQKKLALNRIDSAGSGSYLNDVSPWVIGYILGVEWEDVTVAYTNHQYAGQPYYSGYQGRYMYTTKEASPFEALLARVGDKIIEYESTRYKQQRLIAFSNWPTTDPFTYPDDVSAYFMKCAEVDVEHIRTTDAFLSGHFASYHVYPYYPDYLDYIADWSSFGLNAAEYTRADGTRDGYLAYLTMLNEHHSIPVVIAEFGVSTGRGMAQRDRNTGRNQGHMSESGQGAALVSCYEDIRAAGCAGCCVFSWQDEWFKRTWNTMYAVDLRRTPYWSDYQTNEQYFGLLSFDPGAERSICYVDGDLSEWTAEDTVTERDGLSVSMKYDERFLYFRIHKDRLDFQADILYLPIDVTPCSGSSYYQESALRFDRAADFLVVLNGADNSHLLVQERYESLRSTYAQNVWGYDTYTVENTPQVDSPVFTTIQMILQTSTQLLTGDDNALAETFETGLLACGNANPEDPDFNSLADFCCTGDDIELKLPWQLLNFADPSRMMVHDDYYAGNYGVTYRSIDAVYVGVGDSGTAERIVLAPLELKGWDKRVSYHERLKSSYYILQAAWKGGGA